MKKRAMNNGATPAFFVRGKAGAFSIFLIPVGIFEAGRGEVALASAAPVFFPVNFSAGYLLFVLALVK